MGFFLTLDRGCQGACIGVLGVWYIRVLDARKKETQSY